MEELFKNLISQFRELPPGRQVALAMTAAGSLAFFLWLGTSASDEDYRLLFRGLDDDQAVKVVQGLDAEKIPYRLGEGGAAIYAPGPMVYEARLRVAGRGLPGGGAGFEIFDTARFGVTDFVQKVNYARALQGELARSIEQLEAVERARVQLVIAEKSGFVRREEKEARASVVVRLRSGASLDESQVQAMVHLIASSVSRLKAQNVTIVDTHGNLLAPLSDGNAGPGAPSSALAQQKRVEAELSDRIETLLERTVGRGRVIAKVHADLDWTQSEQTEETFDPDSQVARSEQRSSESSTDTEPQAGGVPGVRANQPGGIAATAGTSERTARTQTETINYEISRITRRRVDPVGTIKRLDVAILLDGKPSAPSQASEEGETSEPTFIAWSAEELSQFEELAKRAVGFSEDRGDRITITSAPFRTIELAPVEGFQLDPQWVALLSTLLNYLGLVIALVLFHRLLAKPLIEKLSSAPAGAPRALSEGQPPTAGELEAALAAGGTGPVGLPAELEEEVPLTLAEQIGMITEARSDDSVKTIRGWLDQ